MLYTAVACLISWLYQKGIRATRLIGKSTQVIFSRTREVAKGKHYRVRGLLQAGSSSPRWTLGITALALSSKGLDLLGQTHNLPIP